MKFSLLAMIAYLFGLAPSSGADAVAEQEGRYKRRPAGKEVSPPRALEGMALGLGRTNPAGIAELVPVADAPGFEKAMRLITRHVPEKPGAFQAAARTVANVKKNDLMLAIFWARAAGVSESAEGAFTFELAAEPHTRAIYHRFECEREWRRFFVPFVAASDSAAGEAVLRFHAGYGPQVLELGGLRVINYEAAVAFTDMPYTPLTYKGRNADAPWRAHATAAIEKERKAQFTILVLNSRGKPMPWTEVRVRQLQHAFGFGTVVTPTALLDDSDHGELYRWHVLESFNQVEMSEGLDWEGPAEKRAATLEAAEWLSEYEVQVRSHALFAAEGQLPSDLASIRQDRTEFRRRILEHVREKVGAAKGMVAEWSVPIALSADTELGVGLLAEVLRTAREADPQARLLVHAGNVLADGVDQAQLTAVIQAIRSLLETKAPVQGIALGSHSSERLLAPEKIQDVLDRFAELRLPITVTDHEIDTWDEDAQADYTRDFLTTVFAHPATVACSVGGLWATDHSPANGAFYNASWSERLHFKSWREQVQKKWWSTATVTTNGKGVAKHKGFLGYYAIEVRGAGKPKVVYAKLGKTGKWLQIVLPAPNAKP